MSNEPESFGHEPESIVFDGETWAWKIVCSCQWECWDQTDEEHAWDAFTDHILDDVFMALGRMRREYSDKQLEQK